MKQNVLRVLKWSEKYTRTDMTYLVKGGFWLSVGHGFSILSSLALAVIFANFLPQEAYGVYRFIISLFVIASLFSLHGMGLAIVRGVAKHGATAFLSGVRTFRKWSVGIAIVSFAISLYYLLNGNNTLSLSMLIVGIFAPLYQTFLLYPTLYMGKKEWDTVTRYRIIHILIPAIAVGTTVFFTNSPVLIILSYFISHTATLGVLFLIAKKKCAAVEEVATDTESYGKSLSVINMLRKGIAEIDKVLVFHFLGAAPLAVYAFAQAPIGEIKSIGSIIRNLVLPKLSEKDPEVLKRTIHRKAIIFFLSLIPLVVVYYFAAPYLFEILFPVYTESVFYTQVLALSILLMPSLFYRQSLIAHKQKRALLVIDTAIPLIRLVFLLALLPTLGILGAILAVLASSALKFLASVFFFMRIRI